MHRVWAKIFIAGLIILGDGAFASASNQRNDCKYEASGDAVQLPQPTVLDVTESGWQPPQTGATRIRSDIKLSYQSYAVVTVPVSDLLKYHPFNPRAPPLPAS